MKALLKSVAAAAAIVAAGAAHAVPVTLTGLAILSPYATVSGTLHGNSYNGLAGALRINTIEIGSFVAFCIELDATVSSTYPVTYDYTPYAQDGVARVLSLYGTGAYSATAALVAIWEAVYDSVAGDLVIRRVHAERTSRPAGGIDSSAGRRRCSDRRPVRLEQHARAAQ